MKQTKPSLKTLKNKTWKLFSEYIRRKDADKDGNVKCVTCDYKAHWKKMQAGHFIPGRTNSILFDEKGTHAQCYGCNVRSQGNGPEYYVYMLENYGQAEIDRQRMARYQAKKIKPQDYLDMIEAYKSKIMELENAEK